MYGGSCIDIFFYLQHSGETCVLEPELRHRPERNAVSLIRLHLKCIY